MICVPTFPINNQISFTFYSYTPIHITQREFIGTYADTVTGKLAAVQEINSQREYIRVLASCFQVLKNRHSWLSHELTPQVLAFLLHTQSNPWSDNSKQLGTCLTPDPEGFTHKVFCLLVPPVGPDSSDTLSMHNPTEKRALCNPDLPCSMVVSRVTLGKSFKSLSALRVLDPHLPHFRSVLTSRLWAVTLANCWPIAFTVCSYPSTEWWSWAWLFQP